MSDRKLRESPEMRADLSRSRLSGGMRSLVLVLTLVLAGTLSASAVAESRVGQSTGLPLPRYASLKADLVYMRRGPGQEFPILWELTRSNLPVQIVGEYNAWRRVRLHDGDVGWIHRVMLEGTRFATPIGKGAALRAKPNRNNRRVAWANPSLPLRMRQCSLNWCLVEAKGMRGWAMKQDLWGVGADDIFE